MDEHSIWISPPSASSGSSLFTSVFSVSLHSWKQWWSRRQGVKWYHNSWCTDALGDLFEHMHEIWLFQWWSLFLVKSKTSGLETTLQCSTIRISKLMDIGIKEFRCNTQQISLVWLYYEHDDSLVTLRCGLFPKISLNKHKYFTIYVNGEEISGTLWHHKKKVRFSHSTIKYKSAIWFTIMYCTGEVICTHYYLFVSVFQTDKKLICSLGHNQ